MASDDNMADVWYNIGHVAIRLGDMSLAAQAFKLAVSVDPQHAEALNNLGVLELRKGNVEAARASFASSSKVGAFLYEPNFNAGLLAFKLGDCQAAFEHTRRSLALYPRHAESLDLLAQLKRHFSVS
jgi:tetratricopeptide repeat protein 8